MLRAVLFDLDDTLIDHRTSAAQAVTAWAAEHGITGADVPGRWEAICEPHYARYQRREVSFAEQRRLRVREFLGGAMTDAEADHAFGGYLARYEAGWRAFADAVPALRRARAAGLFVAVVTNGDEGQQRRKLERCGLDPEVDLLIASSTLPAGKPDPRAFAGSLQRVGVLAAEAMMVGDSLEKDVAPARRAGMAATLLDRDDVHADVTEDRITSLDALCFGDEALPLAGER